MSVIFRCFRCGSTDHVKADCPRRTPRTQAPPGRALKGRAGTGEKTSVINLADRRPAPRDDSEVADAKARADRIRQKNPSVFGPVACGDDSDLVNSEFRRRARLPPVHHCQQRERARQQLADSRTRT